MRIAWRWVLPIVPLSFLISAGLANYQRLHNDLMEVPADVRPFLYRGERYGCFPLWNAREDYVAAQKHRAEQEANHGWMDWNECRPSTLTRLSTLTNLPGVIAGMLTSRLAIDGLNWPMPLTFYSTSFLLSFAFWYAVGDWIERRRNPRKDQST